MFLQREHDPSPNQYISVSRTPIPNKIPSPDPLSTPGIFQPLCLLFPAHASKPLLFCVPASELTLVYSQLRVMWSTGVLKVHSSIESLAVYLFERRAEKESLLSWRERKGVPA